MTHQADLAFSDVYQAATGYQTPALNDLIVAVQPFAFTKSVSSPSRLTNITHQQIQPFFANGFLPLSYFTGNTNDAGPTATSPAAASTPAQG